MTPEQTLTLLAAINAETNLDVAKTQHDQYGVAAMMEYFNMVDTSIAWNTSTPTNNVMDKVVWANLTPTDTADGTQTWANRSLACQGKQFNLQTLLQGRQFIDASKSNIRAGLQDALTNIPSGVAGANQGGGWVNVNLSMQRPMTKGERVFATGTGTTASPAILTFEGTLSWQDVYNACFEPSTDTWRVT